MSDQTPANGGSDGTASAPPYPPTPKKPISQGKPGLRDRLPDSSFAWFKQLPTIHVHPTDDFTLIKREDLDALLVGVSPAVATRINDDIAYMERDLLRLFRECDLKAKTEQNRYRLYQVSYIGLAALATVIGSLQALVLSGHVAWVPVLGFVETCVALTAAFLATLGGRESPMLTWLDNRRRAECLRREYFRFLINLPPYNALEGYQRKMTLAQRAASIHKGVYPDEEVRK